MKQKSGINELFLQPPESIRGVYRCCTCEAPIVVKADIANNVYYWCAKCGRALSLAALDRAAQNGQIQRAEDLQSTTITNDVAAVDRKKEKNMQVEVESDFIDAKFAETNPKFTILSEGEYQADKFAKKEGGQKLVLKVKAGGEEKFYSPNKTSLRYLVDKLGSESKKWIGTNHVWEIVPGTMDGKKVKVVYIKGALKE